MESRFQAALLEMLSKLGRESWKKTGIRSRGATPPIPIKLSFSLVMLWQLKFSGTCIAVFFREVDASMRGRGASGLVCDGDLFLPKTVRGKFDLAIFTGPNFGMIEGGIFKFFIARAEGLPIPTNGDLIHFTGNFDQLQGDIIGRDGQRGIIGVNGCNAKRVAFNVHQRGFHPAGIIAADGLNLDPACVIQTADDLKIAAFNETIFIKIGRTGAIATIGALKDFTA